MILVFIPSTGKVIGQCWNCASEKFVIAEFIRWVEILCADCDEPQSVKVAA
jgi:hypothetical protein